MASRGLSIHMLSCARFFYTEQQAIELARAYKIYAKPILTPSAIMFVVGERREFDGVWMDTREGYHFMRGKRKDAKGSSMLHQHARPFGFDKAEGKERVSGS